MINIEINTNKILRKIKDMNCVNNGPYVDSSLGNFDAYKQLRIPYERNHNASFDSGYGGPNIVDVDFIFKDFDCDENDPNNYDFTLTDLLISNSFKAGTKVYYRLGSRIENEKKKHHTLPPKDYLKWAKICEHIIMHYNFGWACGFNYDIEYYEIWNEPDGWSTETDPAKKNTWGGTKEEFFDFFTISIKYLKERFPNLKIGGPALRNDLTWCEDFLKYISNNSVQLDFFSWHCYCESPKKIAIKEKEIESLLEKYGYSNSEIHINECNYMEGFEDEKFKNTVKAIISNHGAVFNNDTMNRLENTKLKLLMYYDARKTVFNGIFDYYTLRPLKGYYPIYFWSNLRELENEVEVVISDDKISSIAAIKDDTLEFNICYFNNNYEYSKEEINLNINDFSYNSYEVRKLDDNSNATISNIDITKPFIMEPDSVIYIKCKR